MYKNYYNWYLKTKPNKKQFFNPSKKKKKNSCLRETDDRFAVELYEGHFVFF